MGIAPGDGDLMPSRFASDRQTDAGEWLQDLLDYMHIRQVPKSTGLVLLRARLTGAARIWLESVPTDIGFDEVIRRFRKRFVDNTGRRGELLTDFWHRRQGPDEPVSTYIEEMASLARRMRLDNKPLMRQGIIQGLRPEIRRDVKVLKPVTLEALAEAATIGESNAKSTARPDDAVVRNQLAEMRAMMAAMQEMMAANQRSNSTANAIDAPGTGTPATSTTTNTATTAPNHPGAAAPAAMPAVDGEGSHMTIQVVLPETAQYGGRRGGPGGRAGRGRGRGRRDPWGGQPMNVTGNHRLNVSPPTFQPHTGGQGNATTLHQPTQAYAASNTIRRAHRLHQQHTNG